MNEQRQAKLGPYQADWLCVLVGENPLPGYVAAHLLTKPEGHLVLIHTTGTEPEKDALYRRLKRTVPPDRLHEIEVDVSDPDLIRAKIAHELSERLKPVGVIGLNYTGGTKAMAVHAYRALYDWCRGKNQRVWFSYLDARDLSLWINGVNEQGNTTPPANIQGVRDIVPVSIVDMLRLHGYGDAHMGRSTPRLGAITPSLFAMFRDDDRSRGAWIDSIKKYKNQYNDFLGNNDLVAKPLPPIESFREDLRRELGLAESPQTLNDVARTPLGNSARQVAEWLDGKWFEDYVMLLLVELQAEGHSIHQIRVGITPRIHRERAGSLADTFEVDVAFTIGYQLFALSCTTSANRKPCKQKLLEATVRAQQIGGREARIGLVCWDNHETHLEKEVGDLFPGAQLRVFGRPTMQADKLKDALAGWITS